MAKLNLIPLRQALVLALRGDPGVTAKIAATSIYGPRTPVAAPWPFVRVHVTDGIPVKATGYDGADIQASVHVFSQSADDGQGGAIADAIARLLDDNVLTREGVDYSIAVDSVQSLPDNEEASQWHHIISLSVENDG